MLKYHVNDNKLIKIATIENAAEFKNIKNSLFFDFENVTNNSIEIEPNKLRRRIKNFIIEKFNLSKNWKLRDGDKVKN